MTHRGASDTTVRTTELAVLARALDGAVAGRGGTLVVRGPAGFGKTCLLRAFARHCEQLDAVCAEAVGSPAERSVTFGVLRQLLCGPQMTGRLPAVATTADRVTEELAARGPRGVVDDWSSAAARQADVLWTALVEAAVDGPVALVIDDAHHSDPESRALLDFMKRRSHTAPVLIACAEPEYAPDPTGGVGPVDAGTDDIEVVLRLLRAAETERLVGELVGGLVEPGIVETVHRWSGGNPALVHAIASSATWSVPAVEQRVAAAALRCIRRTGGSTVDVARAVAVLGDRATPDGVEEVLGAGRAEVARELRRLDALGLLASGRFRSPLTAAAVLDDAGGSLRARLCIRSAGVHRVAGAHREEVADLLDGGETVGDGDERWVTDVLCRTAADALVADDPGRAVSRLLTAARLLHDRPQAGTVLARTAEFAVLTDPDVLARNLPGVVDRLERTGPPSVCLQLVRLLVCDDRAELGRRVLEQVRGRCVSDDPGWVDELRGVARWSVFWCPSLDVGPTPPAGVRAVPHWARPADVLAAVLQRGPDRERVRQADEFLDHLVLHDRSILDGPVPALLVLMFAGELTRATERCGELLSRSVVGDDDLLRAHLMAVRAELSLRRGAHRAALDDADRALEGLLESARGGPLIGFPLGVVLGAAPHVGDGARAEEIYAAYGPETCSVGLPGLLWRAARGRYELDRGRLDTSLTTLLGCGRQLQDWDIDRPNVLPWRSLAASALLGLGDRAAARHLAREQLLLPGPGRPATRAGTTEPARFGVTEPVSSARQDSDPERSVPLRSIDYDVLTDAERRVLTLVVHGHRNRDVAALLGVTLSTVEQHLTKSYRKLGLRGRADLLRRTVPPPR